MAQYIYSLCSVIIQVTDSTGSRTEWIPVGKNLHYLLYQFIFDHDYFPLFVLTLEISGGYEPSAGFSG
jgi:hypothetical protein